MLGYLMFMGVALCTGSFLMAHFGSHILAIVLASIQGFGLLLGGLGLLSASRSGDGLLIAVLSIPLILLSLAAGLGTLLGVLF